MAGWMQLLTVHWLQLSSMSRAERCLLCSAAALLPVSKMHLDDPQRRALHFAENVAGLPSAIDLRTLALQIGISFGALCAMAT